MIKSKRTRTCVHKTVSKMPEISVVVPAYNEEKYIRDTLESIVNQLYRDFELIVVDNNSTDSTPDIAGEYTDKVVHCRVKGNNFARNAGAEKASGNILVFCDADTVISGNLMEEVYRSINSGYVGGACRITPDKKTLKHQLIWLLNHQVERVIGPRNFYGLLIYCTREAFNRVGGFDNRLAIRADHMIKERLLQHGRLEYLSNAYVTTSMRRIDKEGYLRQWTLTYLNKIKPVREYADIR